jgi:hypothetical protein
MPCTFDYNNGGFFKTNCQVTFHRSFFLQVLSVRDTKVTGLFLRFLLCLNLKFIDVFFHAHKHEVMEMFTLTSL